MRNTPPAEPTLHAAAIPARIALRTSDSVSPSITISSTAPTSGESSLFTAPRNGLISGCYPLDKYYTQKPEFQKLKEIKKKAFDKLELEGDEATGAQIVRIALEAPLKQIAINAGLEGGVVVEKVRGLPAGHGLNAATGEYGDLLKAGVPDPAKVVRSALQNAASIAALFLTTEAVVADKPEKTPAPAGAPGGGDMDF